MLCLSNHVETAAFWHIEIPLVDIWVFRPEISEGMAPQDDKRKETEPRWWSAVTRVHEGTLGEETRWIRFGTLERRPRRTKQMMWTNNSSRIKLLWSITPDYAKQETKFTDIVLYKMWRPAQRVACNQHLETEGNDTMQKCWMASKTS